MRRGRGRMGTWVAIGIGIAAAVASCATPQRPSAAASSAGAAPSSMPAENGAVTAFVDVRVFDGESMMQNATVLIEDERIVAVGHDVAVPAGATIVDGRGRTLLPGLIDAHTHTWDATQLETALVFGVTTMLDMMTPAEAAARFQREQAGADGFARADLLSSGYAATAPGGHGTEYGFAVPTLTTPGEAAAFVAERVAEGSDYIKIIHDDGSLYSAQRIPTLDEATMRALVDAAHEHGRLAVVHPGTLAGARASLRAGADGLVHVWGDSVPSSSFIDAVHDAPMFVIPTLGVQQSVSGVAAGASLVDDEWLAPFLDADARANLRRAFPVSPASRASYEAAATSTALLRERGVPVLVGTDAPNPGTWYGVSVHDELTRLVRDAGFSPIEALRAATSVPADEFGLDDRGRIAIGLRADLVLMQGDPSADISATRDIVGVWKRGRRLDRDAFAAHVGARLAAAATADEPVVIPAGGLLLSDFDAGSASATLGRWVVSTDQLAGGASTGSMEVRDGALAVSGTVAPGLAYAWSGVMLFPAAQPMQPANLSAASGVSFRARGPGSFQIALFTERGGRMPAVRPFVTTGEWARYTFEWSDFGAHDGSDVLGIAILAGPAPGDFEFAVDDVTLLP